MANYKDACVEYYQNQKLTITLETYWTFENLIFDSLRSPSRILVSEVSPFQWIQRQMSIIRHQLDSNTLYCVVLVI